jgi:glycosyltransferase involved in cell wall biosynthesis
MSRLVSVVVIFHNEERFLADAIRSVQEQTHTAWELLLVDDGSTDGSAAIAAAAAAADPARIRCLEHPGRVNRGMSASRNLGLFAARGEYVAFLDGDDIYLPERLRRHVEILDAQPGVGVVQSDHIRWRSWSGADPRHDLGRPFLAVGDQLLQPPLGLLRILLVPYLVAGICNITVRREAAVAAGGFVDRFSSLYEDQAFVARMMHAHSVYILQEYLACYRHHPRSATRTLKEQGGRGSLVADELGRAYWDWLIDMLEPSRLPESAELLAIARARRVRLDGSGLRRARLRAAGAAKGALRAALPAAWYERLLDLDYALDERAGRRAYRAMTEALAQRARERAALPRTSQPSPQPQPQRDSPQPDPAPQPQGDLARQPQRAGET